MPAAPGAARLAVMAVDTEAESARESGEEHQLTLHAWHELHGARWLSCAGCAVPADYGDPEAERAAVLGAVAIADVSAGARLELVGEDRARFLNGLVTCDIAALDPGQGSYGFFTTPQGRVLADVVVLALEDRLWLELPPGSGQDLRAHLEKYIVADRVEVRTISDLVTFRLVGPSTEPLLEGHGQRLPEGAFAHGVIELPEAEVHASRTSLCGAPAVTLWMSSGIAQGVLDDLLSQEGGPRLVGFSALESARLLAGIPRFGPDFDDGNLPQEIRLDDAVSYDKGCYLGQEIVARLHYRGQPARELRRLHGSGEPPPPGAVLEASGERAGLVTGAVAADSGEWRGLAMIERRYLVEDELRWSGQPVSIEPPAQVRAR